MRKPCKVLMGPLDGALVPWKENHIVCSFGSSNHIVAQYERRKIGQAVRYVFVRYWKESELREINVS